MRLLLLFFLIGFAAAASLPDAKSEIAQEAPLKRSLASAEGNDEMARKVREALERILEKVKEAVEKGKTIHVELIDKIKDLRQKLKDKRIEISDKAKELIERIKEKSKDYLKNIFDKINIDEDDEDNVVALADFNIRNIFQKLKDIIKQKVDKEALKEKIEQLFGKGSEMADQLMNLLKDKAGKGKQKLLDFIDRILGEEEEGVARRSLHEVWEKVRNFFKDLKIDLKEKYMKFGDWVRNTLKEKLDKSKDKLENIKSIAKEFVTHTKTISKEVAVEALDFLRQYKDDLHELYDQVKDSVREILGRKD